MSGNSASGNGGGAIVGTLNNCVLTGNSAGAGGGACYGTLNNCTLSGNSASGYGGGINGGTLNNCIVYYNTAPQGANFDGSTLNYCCTTPTPANATGNLVVEPELASASHLSAGSPCRGAGSAAYTTGVDIDGESWLSPPSIGCDEYCSGSFTGTVSVAIAVTYTNVAVAFSLDFQGSISGRVGASRWEFGDGTIVSNRPYASHAWRAAGDYAVVLRAYNESYPAGVTTTTAVHVVAQPVHYVSLSSASPSAPYSTWGTAATNIQLAVDATSVVGSLVLVSNGVYQAGGKKVYGSMSNRVAVDKPVTVASVNGPEVTVIQGQKATGGGNGTNAVRCVFLANGAVLAGFTLTNGATLSYNSYGGGIYCQSVSAVVSNCVLAGNSASYGGGGTYSGTLNNCTLRGNSASISGSFGSVYGGGAYSSTLNNCTLTGNSASYSGSGSGSGYGGGAYSSTLSNCTLTGNSASYSGSGSGPGSGYGGGAYSSTLNNCTLTRNSASQSGIGAYVSGSGYGGGAYASTLNNCSLTCNSAFASSGSDPSYGGGASSSTLNNCTLTGNSIFSYGYGGGAYSSTLNNCIAYYNSAWNGSNYSGGALNYCCTAPFLAAGRATRMPSPNWPVCRI